MVQLWVNLPMKDKMTTPGYQSTPTMLSRPLLPDNAGVVRVIAGRYEETRRRTLSRRSMSGICACSAQSPAYIGTAGRMEHRAGGTERQYHGERHDAGQRNTNLVVLSPAKGKRPLHLEASSDASVLLLSERAAE